MRRLPDSLASLGSPRITDSTCGEGSRAVGFFGCWLTVLLGVLGVQFSLLTMFGVELSPVVPLLFGILFSFVSCVPFFCTQKRYERIVFLCIFLFFIATVALFSRVVIYSLNTFLNVCIDRINQNSIVTLTNFDLSVLNHKILYMSLPYTTTYGVALAFVAALFSQLFAFFTFSARLPGIPVVLSAAVLGSGLFCLLLPGPIPFLLLVSFCLAALFGKAGRRAQPAVALERVNRKKVRTGSKASKDEKRAKRSPVGAAAFYMTVFLLIGSLLSALLIPQDLHFRDDQFAKWSEQLGRALFGEGGGSGFGSFGGVGNGSLRNLDSLSFTGREVFTLRGNPPADLYLRARASAVYRPNQWSAEEQPLPPFRQGYASTVEAYFNDRLDGSFGSPESFGFLPGRYTIDPADSMARLEPPLFVYPADYVVDFSANSPEEDLFAYTVPKMNQEQMEAFRISQQEFLSRAQQAAEEAAGQGERLYFMDWYVLEDAPSTYDGSEYFGKASIPGVDGVEEDAGFYAELRTLAQEILDEYGLGDADEIGREDYYAVASAFASYLSTHYSYTLEPGGPASRNDDVVEYFLFENRKGFCVHFASAMTLLLRTIDVPTRYAEGYAVSSSQFSNGTATVRDRNAHAWPEVFIEGIGWLPFEPTPGGGALAEHNPSSSQPQSSAEGSSSTSSAQSSSQSAVSSAQPSSSGGSSSLAPGPAENEQGTAGLLALYLAAAAVLLVLGVILRRQLLSSKRRRSFDAEAVGCDAAIGNLYAYLCTLLSKWKLTRANDEPFPAFAQRVQQHPAAQETGVPFEELFAAVLRARFDSAPCGEQDYQLVRNGVEKLAAAFAASSPLLKRLYYRYLLCIL